ncbi:hypothetical protein CCHR01_05457 [Colletotrichum chrysophilum]|uniref:Uncharacterized protein n=1 Tax=Colletotrichum chrysophilum TaxID=1836956 RepID=A0AAD9AQG2_9PEZI|nr:hypothetical protein CCHR01_05457 [Colletotrichum chrysophilum]
MGWWVKGEGPPPLLLRRRRLPRARDLWPGVSR